jgi:hypothetical protein
MRIKFWNLTFSLCLLGTAWSPVQAQVVKPDPAKLQAFQALLDRVKSSYDGMPLNHQAMLDGPSHLVQMARVFSQVAPRISKSMTRREFKEALAEADANLATVNDRSTDLDGSAYAFFTQSETSTARCGNQVVVGFNDSGSVFESAFSLGGSSFSGAAVSSDGGRTFRDIGLINPGPNPNGFLLGDPMLTCTDSSTFYFTQLMFLAHPANLHDLPLHSSVDSMVVVSKSTDGGNTWGDPVSAVTKVHSTDRLDVFRRGHTLDKEWSAIDPSNPQRMYFSYTDFDLSNVDAANPDPNAACGRQSRTAIELVVSNDGGRTFGNPIVIDEQCGDNTFVQASHVAVNSHGLAYIAWERFNADGTLDLRITHLMPNSLPAASVLVDHKVLGGDTFVVTRTKTCCQETDLQGEFRDLVGLDLAVDHSGGPNDGTVYVTWDDGRNKSVPDLLGFDAGLGIPPNFGQLLVPHFTPLILTAGNYLYTDVLVSSSKDGVHFGPSIQVNSDRQPRIGGGHDHFQPAIATDPTGRVAICWYDRRNDPQNLNIERFCAESKSGREWNNFRVPITPFAPHSHQDLAIAVNYMGDYDGLTSDFTGLNNGFIGAFQWMSSGRNPDIKAFRF